MDDSQSVEALISAASRGEAAAWDEIVERYAGLVVSVARRFALSEADLFDVSQMVWLRLVENLPTLRDPRALPGWLVTTAKRECIRVLRQSNRQVLTSEPDELRSECVAVDAELLAAERRSALREAFATLPPAWRELITLLVADPPLTYDEISDRLGIPIGSIGPTRARCIERIRSFGAVSTLLHDAHDGIQLCERTVRATTRGADRGALEQRPSYGEDRGGSHGTRGSERCPGGRQGHVPVANGRRGSRGTGL